jgi:DNA polymerase III epsilon subunit-like protein
MFNSRTAMARKDYGIDKDTFHKDIPNLMVGWDTETTGTEDDDVPISYGLVVYRHGVEQPNERQHFLVNSAKTTSEGAYGVHRISPLQLESSHNGEITRTKNDTFDPALSDAAGLHRFVKTMGDYQKQGATFVGHNIGFDYDKLQRVHDNIHRGLPMQQFDIEKAKKNTWDTMEHAYTMNDKHPIYDKRKGIMRDSVSLEALCDKYGIKHGGHTAMWDADSSVQLLLKQIAKNNGINKTASVGPSGIDYAFASPHSNNDCKFCKHLDDLDAGNRDESGLFLDKDQAATVKFIRKVHKDGIGYAKDYQATRPEVKKPSILQKLKKKGK